MVRPALAEQTESKPKVTQKVSTLTPEQLARKRARDRQSQKAIRARKKEQLERLELEVAELKSQKCRDRTIQNLLRHHQATEKELVRVKEIMATLQNSSNSPTPCLPPSHITQSDVMSISTPCDDNLLCGNNATCTHQASRLPDDYNAIPKYSQAYLPLSKDWQGSDNTASYPTSPSIPSLSSVDYSLGYSPVSLHPSTFSSNDYVSSNISGTCYENFNEKERNIVRHNGSLSQEVSPYRVKLGEEVGTHPQGTGIDIDNSPLRRYTADPHPGTLHRGQQNSVGDNCHGYYY